MSNMCQQGFDDALRFLQRNNKISCTRCLAIQSSFVVDDSDQLVDEELLEVKQTESNCDNHTKDDCIDCQYKRETALLESLPDPISKAIQEVCDEVNKSLINWLFKYRPVKLVSLITAIYFLPFDVATVVLVKLWRQVPDVKKHMKQSLVNFLSFAKSCVLTMDSKRHLFSAKFSCQLSVTEYDYARDERSKPYYLQSTPAKKLSVVSSRVSIGRKTSDVYASIPAVNREKVGRSALNRRNNSVDDIRAKLLQKASNIQRKSYAGFSDNSWSPKMRRRSLTEINRDTHAIGCKPPERVLSSMNFGFTVDLTPSATPPSVDVDEIDGLMCHQGNEVQAADALNRLSEDDDMLSCLTPLELASRALHWEPECRMSEATSDVVMETQNQDAIEKIIDLTTNQNALMTIYYKDDNNRLKVTEIFKISEDEAVSGIITPGQIEANDELQWDSFDLRLPQRSSSNTSASDDGGDGLPEVKLEEECVRQRKKAFIFPK